MIEAGQIYLCETIEDAKGFLKQCDKQGIKWCDGTKASDEINYSYDEDTCYHVNSSFNREPNLTYAHRETYEDDGYEITVYVAITDEEIAAIDFEWKKLMQIKEGA